MSPYEVMFFTLPRPNDTRYSLKKFSSHVMIDMMIFLFLGLQGKLKTCQIIRQTCQDQDE
jgi:hypothetical protein